MTLTGTPDYSNTAVSPGALLATGTAVSGTPFSQLAVPIDNTVRSITIVAIASGGDLSACLFQVTGTVTGQLIIRQQPPTGAAQVVMSGRCFGIEDTTIAITATTSSASFLTLWVYAEYDLYEGVAYNGVELQMVGQYGTWTVNQGGTWTVTATQSPANPAANGITLGPRTLAASMAIWTGPLSGTVYLTSGIVSLAVTAVTTGDTISIVTPAGQTIWQHRINAACQLNVPITYPYKRQVASGASGTIEVVTGASLSATGTIAHNFDYSTAA